MALSLPKAWMDKCVVTVTQESGSDTEWGAMTRDITIGGGEQAGDILNVNTGQIYKRGRHDMFTITFDNVIPIEVDDFRQFKEGGSDATQPKEVTAGYNFIYGPKRFRIAIAWCEINITSGARQAVTDSARRLIVKDCYFTGFEENWTDQMLNGNATFQINAVNETGGHNLLWQSNDGTATLSTLSAYTGGNFGTS